MKNKNKCSRYLRGNIHLSNASITKTRCKLCIGILLLLFGAWFSITWINWDAAVVYSPPQENIAIVPQEVDDNTLLSKRWKEKRSYITEVFVEACSKGYQVVTNLNVKILSQPVKESMVYFCESSTLYVNLRINYDKSGATRLICNETWGNTYKIEDERYHPVEYSYVVEDDIARATHSTLDYEQTCLMYQADELLKGEWKPKSI